jgi:hypothetical protein
MALARSIWWILLVPPKHRFFSSSKIEREIFGFGKKPLWELVPCIEVTLVSKFHPIWCHVAQESKLSQKFLGGPDISGSFTGYIR